MIIHISGPSGSGKTTLGNKIAKISNTIVIDTDDIDDPNSIKIIKKYSFNTKKDEKIFTAFFKKMFIFHENVFHEKIILNSYKIFYFL